MRRRRKMSTEGQPALIDVGPKQPKEIVKKARAYRALAAERQAILGREVKLKNELLAMIKDEHLTPTEDGKIQIHVDGVTIIVTPRDELIKVREDSDAIEE